MSYQIQIPFYAARLRFTGEGEVFVPLAEKSVVRLDNLNALSARFQRAFQKKVLNEGEYDQLLKYQQEGSYTADEVSVDFPTPKNKSYPAFEVTFDFLYTGNEFGYTGIVPATGAEAYGEDVEELKANMAQSIRLEFVREERLRYVQRLIPALWYESVELETKEIRLKFYTPSELEKLSETEQESWLNKAARQLVVPRQVAYGRDKDLEQLARILKGRFNRNILLVGASGVGKTALIWELARRGKKLGVERTIWETTASTLIRELTKEVGWEQNLALFCRELSNKGEILFIRNFLELFEVGQYAGNNISMAEYMRTYLSRGEISLISECTPEEFAQIELRSPNYASMFQVVRLEEPRTGLEDIIIKKVSQIAHLENMDIEPEAIKETIRLNRRFTPYSGFPGKPIRFLESILLNQKNSDKQAARETRQKVQTQIHRSDVIRYFCEETGMPTFMVDPEVPMDMDEAAMFFRSNVFGQEAAVVSVMDMLAMVKTALSRQGKPIASFLFVGPTGVGKTEMAKVLAEFMFGNRNRMLRFDMSEFSNPYDVQRLTGLNYYSDGLLTAAVRREPFCVLLFDEIEKADATFYDLLLQMLGEGRLTDSSGRLVNFCSTIIIMTSNIGAKSLQADRIGWKTEVDTDDVNEHFLSEVRKHFRPELFNRMDSIIPFQPISKQVVKYVVKREINLLKKREGILHRNITFELSDALMDYFAVEGYDPKYGARQIQRTLQETLVLPLSEKLNLYDFDDILIVKVDIKDEQPSIHIQADPLKTELLIEELTRNNWTEHTSDLRRSIARMGEGRFYNNLMSQLDILERQKKRKGEKFWKDEKKTRQYTDYLKTKERVDAMTVEIRNLEEEYTLAGMGLSPYRDSMVQRTESWEKSFTRLKMDLYQSIYPGTNLHKIMIRGGDVLESLQLYLEICALKKYDYEVETIWYRKELYEELVEQTVKDEDGNYLVEKVPGCKYVIEKQQAKSLTDFKPPELNDEFVGAILTIKGDCVQVYFNAEQGVHKWKQKTGKYNTCVVSGTNEVDFVPPVGSHIRRGWGKLKPSRTYDTELLTDTEYSIKKEVHKGNYIVILMDIMDRRFEETMDNVLN